MGNPATISDNQIHVEPAEYQGSNYLNVRPSLNSSWEVDVPKSPADKKPAIVIDLTPQNIQPVTTDYIKVDGNVPIVKVEIRPESTSVFKTLYENASTNSNIKIKENVDAIRITLMGSTNDKSEIYIVKDIFVHACFKKTGENSFMLNVSLYLCNV